MTDTKFFKELYQFCDDGMIEIRSLPSGRQEFLSLDEVDTIPSLCNGNQDHYFGVALRKGGGTKDHITQIPSLYVDCDYKDTPKEILRENFKKFPFKPSAIIESGGGIHAYFFLDEPCTKNDIKEFEDTNRKIAAALEGDLQSSEAARILRIPGTQNHKYKPKRKVNLLSLESFRYSLDDFSNILYNNNTSIYSSSSVPIDGLEKTESLDVTDVTDCYIREGERDKYLFHLANYLVKGGMPTDNIRFFLKLFLRNCCEQGAESYPEKDLELKIKSALRRLKKTDRNLAGEIREWIRVSSGYFFVSECYHLLSVVTFAEKAAVRQVLHKLKKDEVIEQVKGGKAGQYRIVEKNYQVKDLTKAKKDTFYFELPFGLENFVSIKPRNVIVFAGEINSGKSALLCECVRLNMGRHKITYFDFEGDEQEMAERLEQHHSTALSKWTFDYTDDPPNYFDIIKPDEVNIIDYVEAKDKQEAYDIPKIIAGIHDKLRKGIAVIALQKNVGKEDAFGGQQTKAKARLACNIIRVGREASILKVTKAKGKGPICKKNNTHPEGLWIKFQTNDGINLIPTTDWQWKTE